MKATPNLTWYPAKVLINPRAEPQKNISCISLLREHKQANESRGLLNQGGSISLLIGWSLNELELWRGEEGIRFIPQKLKLWGAHGGGAFFDKNATKVNNCAYIVRQTVKSIVARRLARRCLVQVSYAIGIPKPLSGFVDSYGTGKITDKEVLQLVKENFNFRLGMIPINLDMKREKVELQTIRGKSI